MQHIFIPYCFDTRGCYANLSGNRKLHLTFHFLPVVGPCGSTWAFSGRSEQGLLFSEVQASHCGGFSCCEAWTLDAQAQQLWPMNLVAPWHVESCLTKDRTSIPCMARWILGHRPPRKPQTAFLTLLLPVRDK